MGFIEQARHRAQSEVLVRRYNQIAGVQIHPTARLIGAPIISLEGKGWLEIGAATRLVSVSTRTALGVNHPVVLRCLLPGAELLLGQNVGISGGSICAVGHVELGDGTMLGANVTICDTDFHPLAHPERWSQPTPPFRERDAVVIGKNCFLGTGAIILKGTRLGDGCVVGAGAVVTGSHEPGSIIAGNPARLIRTIDLTAGS